MRGISENDLRQYVIKPVLKHINLWSDAAENLLLCTAAHESHLGHYLKQVRGPALGIYQIEPATHKDVWVNYLAYRNDLVSKVKSLTSSINSNALPADDQLITNLAYATAIARLIYQRAPDALPDADDIDGLANYWKQYYNTPLGKGTTDDFITHYHQYVVQN